MIKKSEQIYKKSLMILQEISRIGNKLEDSTISQEEKLSFSALQKEKIEEFGKTYKLYLEASKSEYKPETRKKTREERIESQRNRIEQLKDTLERNRIENGDDSIIKIVLEREREELKYLEERQDYIPVVYTDFWSYIEDKFKCGRKSVRKKNGKGI